MMQVDVDPVDVVKALAEPLRWRIVELLATEELCVCHLVEELDVPQPLVSHHLKVLRDAGLVDSERFGTGRTTACAQRRWPTSPRTLGRVAEQSPTHGRQRRPCC